MVVEDRGEEREERGAKRREDEKGGEGAGGESSLCFTGTLNAGVEMCLQGGVRRLGSDQV